MHKFGSIGLIHNKNTTFYHMYKKLYDDKHQNDVIRFAKIEVFFFIMEVLITIYILEMYGLLTNAFSIQISFVSIIPFIVFLPVLIAVPILLFFLLIVFVCIMRTAYMFTRKYGNKTISDMQYHDFIRKYTMYNISIHILGFAFYMVISSAIATFIASMIPGYYDRERFVVEITTVGGLLGFLWNLSGLFRYQRILWSKVFADVEVCCKVEDAKRNFYCYMANMVMTLLILFVLIGMFGYVIFDINYSLREGSIVDIFTTGFGQLLIPFFSLIAVYVKKGYSLVFSSSSNQNVCPALEVIHLIQVGCADNAISNDENEEKESFPKLESKCECMEDKEQEKDE